MFGDYRRSSLDDLRRQLAYGSDRLQMIIDGGIIIESAKEDIEQIIEEIKLLHELAEYIKDNLTKD